MNWENELVASAPDQEIVGKVIAAIKLLFESDKFLFQVNSSERSISHRLALYLTPQFADFDVDCEYNRDAHEIKRLQLADVCGRSADSDGSPVLPDIIVHRRGTEDNELVIEIKKSTSSVPDEFDLEKLTAFREELHYKAALFLRIKCGEDSPTISTSKWV